MIDEGNENINKRDEGGDANGICCTTREDCESINGNVMKNRVGYKERLFETSRKGDLILRHIYLYIEKNPKISLLSYIPRLTLRLGLSLLIIVPYFIFSREEKLKGILKLSSALGGLAYIIGTKNNFYK